MRGRGVEVAGRTIPGVIVVSVGFSSMRALRLLKFVSSILLSLVSRVRQRVASCLYVSKSSRTRSSIRYR